MFIGIDYWVVNQVKLSVFVDFREYDPQDDPEIRFQSLRKSKNC